MRATRRLDQMRQEQAATVGLAKGGGGKHGRKRVAEKPTLKTRGSTKTSRTKVASSARSRSRNSSRRSQRYATLLRPRPPRW
jgi:hypothetical protein